MTFVDANVFMYAAGAPHPHKHPSVAFLRRAATGEVAVCTGTEVLQEILHRYRAIDRWTDGKRVLGFVRRIVPVIYPVDLSVVDEALRLLDKHPSLMARDGIHAATCVVHGVSQFCTFDRDFEAVAFLQRVEPGQDAPLA